MKIAIGLLLVMASTVACSTAPPIQSGEYKFQHRFAEQPTLPSITVDVRIKDRHIVVSNNETTDVFPRGVIDEGTLMWHTASRQWIIGEKPTDAELRDVGGCSDGPQVVDLKGRVFWTC